MRFSLFARLTFFLLFILVLASTRLPNAQASTLPVTSLNDSGAGSLRDVVANAVSGDSIFFSVSGTITLTSGHITIDKNLIIGSAIPNITIDGNNASRIFQINVGVTAEIRNMTLTNAEGNFQGGAILNSGILTVNNVIFSSNSGSAGGAIFSDGNLTISSSTFINNIATNANMGGGAIYNNSSTLIINNSLFSDNQTSGSGGAIGGGGMMTITNTTISDNTAEKFGGGLINIVGTLTINGSTISENVATTNDGGGVYSSDVLNITNSTLSNNHAGANGGGLLSANAIIDSSTIVNNIAPTAGNIYVSANITTISRSIINLGSCAFANSGILANGGNNIAFTAVDCPGTNVNPMLGTLGTYGGPTQTIPLLSGSPAIDAYSANCPAIDQRGKSRPQGNTCDIGAYEWRSPLVVTNLNDSGVGSLRDTYSNALADDTIIFNVSGIITLASSLGIGKNIVIDGSGQSITISGNNTVQIFSVGNSVRFEIRNLSLINGRVSGTTFGGAIVNQGGTLTIDNIIFNGNTSGFGAGAIYIASGTVTINNSTFSENSTTTGGIGGAISHYSGTLTISNSTFSGNSANKGGAIALNSGSIMVNNSTFSGNSATSSGAVVYATDIINASVLNINSSTFLNNTAIDGGTIFIELDVDGSAAEINTSILSNGSCSGTITDGGNNIAFNASGCPGANVDPVLGTLGNYGGFTQTIPLLEGSPAINVYSSNCPATDQRGISRPQGVSCDIGAFEFEETAPPTTTIVTENEFYTAVESVLAAYPDINNVVIDFVPNGFNLTVITQTGVVGNVALAITQEQGFVVFNITSITVNGGTAPDSYITIINRDLPLILIMALDNLVTARFGDLVDVQSLTITNSTLTLSLD